MFHDKLPYPCRTPTRYTSWGIEEHYTTLNRAQPTYYRMRLALSQT
jgi:hypothetical protein